MIRGTITHPEILRALAGAGHMSTVLIADANYAASTTSGRNAVIVHLNLTAGRPSVVEVLEAIMSCVAIEAAMQIKPSGDALPSDVQSAVAQALKPIPVTLVERAAFYGLARADDLALVVVTGDTARFGNVLLRLAPLLL